MQVAVVVDDREPADLVADFRAHADVAAVTVRRLEAGDVVVEDAKIAVERKTPRDYVHSALGADGTSLDDQIRKMQRAYAHSYVLVEGDLRDVEDANPGVAPAAVRGTVASYTARTGTPVVPCGDRARLVDLTVRLGRKHVEEPSARPLDAGPVARRAPTAERMLGCIDGIGPELAARLHEAYPSVAALARATPEELQAVAGVGEARARAIHAALRGDEA